MPASKTVAAKLKTDVRINENPEVTDLDLDLTPDQAVVLLENVMQGHPVVVNLRTPKNGPIKDNPRAYVE